MSLAGSFLETVKYTYKLEVWEGLQYEKHDLPSHTVSFTLKTVPGSWFKVSAF